MGTPPDDYDGILVTFAGIQRNDPTKPIPPNGTWKVPRVDYKTWARTFENWIVFFTLDILPMDRWYSSVGANHISETFGAFYCANFFAVDPSPFQFINMYEEPITPYSLGSGSVCFLTGL